MNQEPVRITLSSERLQRAPLVGISVAFLLVMAVCILGLWNDLTNRSKLMLSAEVSNLQSHVERTIIRIETDLREGKSLGYYAKPNVAPWLADHWKRMIESKPNRLYAAVEGTSGELLSYGGKLDLVKFHQIKSEPISGFPSAVNRLTLGDSDETVEVIEVALPINKNDYRVGTYRTAIPADWLDSNLASMARSRWMVWIAILTAMTLIVATTAIFLFRLGAHSKDLEQALKTSETRRLADLSKLVVSMAHELRNPLNSIRLNLFTSEKLIRGDSAIHQDEALVMIHESVSEIERVNELIGQLLGFVKADNAQDTWLNLDNEIQSTLQFLKPTHAHHSIQIHYQPCELNVIGKVSKKYFRQILINLLQNSRQMIPSGGTIRLELKAEPSMAILTIEDSGPGVPTNLLEKIFEPFYSTRPDGAGLGLAVVKNLMEACGGTITCQKGSVLGGLKTTLRFKAKPIVAGGFETKNGSGFAEPPWDSKTLQPERS